MDPSSAGAHPSAAAWAGGERDTSPCGAGEPQSFSTCEHRRYRRCSAKLLTFQSLFLARRLNIISYLST